jgi:septation ring formation regulator EzrA
MNEKLLSIEKRTSEFFDFISDLRWDDAAAREMRPKYLHPLENDAHEMLVAYKDMDHSLELAIDQIKKAEAQMIQAEEAGKEIYRCHEQAQDDIRHTNQELEQSKKQESNARLKLPGIQQLIARANAAGR